MDIPTRRAGPDVPLPSSYGTTPGGTIFSTTPGGTRIVYDRSALLHLKNSPMSKTPPKNFPAIPGVTILGSSPSRTASLSTSAKFQGLSVGSHPSSSAVVASNHVKNEQPVAVKNPAAVAPAKNAAPVKDDDEIFQMDD